METQHQSQANNFIKKSTSSAALLVLLGALSTPAMSAGVGKITTAINSNQFTNSGVIKTTSEASGGVSTSLAGSRVIAPILVGQFNYSSTNDQFDNAGTIEAKSSASGGVSTAMAGQLVVAPSGVGTFDNRSADNSYRNTGEISASSTASGGVSTSLAGQDVTF